MDFRPELSWEFLSEDEIIAKTVRALRNHIRHVKEYSAFYRSLLGQVAPEDIASLDAFARLPLTTRKNLAESSSQFLAVPAAQIVETVVTAGDGGRSLPFALTASDLERIAFSHALSLHGMGVTAADRVLLLMSLDRCFLDGMALYRGAITVGANIMRIGTGVSMQAVLQRYLQFFKPTILAGTPSALRAIAADLARNGYDAAKSPVEKIIGAGEALSTKELAHATTRTALETLWGAQVFSIYPLTELSVAYGECAERNGGHAHPELVYTEIIDENGRPLPDGEIGELTATPLGVEGVPLVRYRTGDITFRIPGGCSCGRHSCRIGPILGKKSQLFTYRGTIVYPLVLTNALDAIDEIQDYLVIIENDERGGDEVTIHAAAPPTALEKIKQAIRDSTGVRLQVLVSNVPTIRGLRGGTTRKIPIIDHRGKTAAKAE
ncbi:MAG: phenylacetate--CoA ligase family protein [Chitinispirillaceae bacterium]|nr:phenylacetate--CoA ligase family protein [Chitinispirillaceae bacterium]